MTNQGSLTVATRVKPGRLETLRQKLTAVERRVRAGHGIFQSINADAPHVHFARWVLLEEKQDLGGQPLGPHLLYLCDFDLIAETHLAYLVRHRRDTLDGRPFDVLDELYSNCEDYPDAPSEVSRLDYLNGHAIAAQTIYVNTLGRTVAQVWRERALREAIESFLDSRSWLGASARQTRAAVKHFVGGREDLKWALTGEDDAAFPLLSAFSDLLVGTIKDVLRRGITLTVEGLKVLGSSPLMPALPGELNDTIDRQNEADIAPLAPDVIEELEEFDRRGAVQSPFSAVGLVRPAMVDTVLAHLTLFAANVGAHYLYGDGSLAGVKTIHFARWIFIDEGRRVLFCSSYDGSLENYMSDFIDLVAWGLNLVFGHGVGYPPTVLGVGQGAEHELKFRRFLRNRQLPARSVVWYTAYPTLSTSNLKTNRAIREQLPDRRNVFGFPVPLSEPESRAWLRNF